MNTPVLQVREFSHGFRTSILQLFSHRILFEYAIIADADITAHDTVSVIKQIQTKVLVERVNFNLEFVFFTIDQTDNKFANILRSLESLNILRSLESLENLLSLAVESFGDPPNLPFSENRVKRIHIPKKKATKNGIGLKEYTLNF